VIPREARLQEIRVRLERDGFCTVADLVRDFAVTDMTIRRDLRALASQGLADVVHGGVRVPRPRPFTARDVVAHESKVALARLARSMVVDGSTLLLDAGTTVAALAEQLRDGFQGHVLTHSVPVLAILQEAPSVHVIGLGGDLNRESRALVGASTVAGLTDANADICFLGAAAVSPAGIKVMWDGERATKLAMLAAAKRRVVLVDHMKWSASAPLFLTGWESVDVVVTDRLPPPEALRSCEAAGVDVLGATA